MKKLMYTITIILAAALVGSLLVYVTCGGGVFLTLVITAGTTLYHFVMRLVVGGILLGIFHNQMDYTRPWFQEKAFEKPLYRILKVKKWKNYMPTYQPEWFDVKKCSFEDILMAGCEAEVGHTLMAIFSFLPIALSGIFGAVGVFIITSVVAALMDLIFVVMQRYNRPRYKKMVNKQKNRIS